MVDDGDAKRIVLLDDTAIERDPVLDAAIGPALLATIGRDGGPDRLRLYRPGPTVAFSGRDCATSGIGEAAAAAAAAGFTPVRRGPGGRAAAYHRGALCLDHVSADVDARSDIRARFIGFGELLVDALRAVGTDARLGPMPGEYCPGEFSINDGHGRKLVGTAQRLVRGAWLFGTVIMVTGAEPVRSVLVDAYRALGLDWNPGTVGSVEDTVPGVTVADVQRAVLEGYARLGELTPGGLSAEVLQAADDRRDHHQVLPTGPPPAVIPPIHAVE
ncbi:biotin/lipoate A/B protein ligase family protein [Nakamurella sp.]|uniref:biotin/lipoate A/B protein ligase family protein n=1 Tax=Nakamurella sp. TaxID=1869182 RepID=UPI003783F2C6